MPIDTQIVRDQVTAAPLTYTIPGGMQMIVKAIHASFDGAGATTAWLPAVQLVSDSGHVIATGVDQAVQVPGGSSADLSFFPDAGRAPDPGAYGETLQLFHLVAANSTNATSVKASPGSVAWYFVGNTAATFQYVRLYDTAGAPTVGTTATKAVFAIPPASGANVALPSPLDFPTGIGLGTTLNPSDADSTAVAASSLIISLGYL